jgi:23S rRNA G2069 N7-methylase RlmK/C1962 C5-methylase RlmI
LTGEEFYELYHNDELRDFIHCESRMRSRNHHVREEYIQEAWLIISTAPYGRTIEYYKDIVSFAIRNAGWTEYKNSRIQRYLGASHSIEVEFALREQQGREEALDYIESKYKDAGVILERIGDD